MKKSWFFLCVLLCLSVFVIGQAAKKEKATLPNASPQTQITPLDLGKAAYIRWQESGQATDAEKMLIQDYLRAVNPSALETDNPFKVETLQDLANPLTAGQLEYQAYAAEKERYYVLLDRLESGVASAQEITEIKELSFSNGFALPDELLPIVPNSPAESPDRRNPLDQAGGNCATAMIIPGEGLCGFTDSGILDGTNDCSLAAINGPYADLFYEVTPDITRRYQFFLRLTQSGGTPTTASIRIVKAACCSTATQTVVINNTSPADCGFAPGFVYAWTSATLSSDTTYYIHIGVNTPSYVGNAPYFFNATCIDCPNPETGGNNSCLTAQTIACNDSVIGSGALTSNDWYTFTVSSGDSVKIYVGTRQYGHCLSRGTTGVDARFDVYNITSGCPGALILTNDDGGCGPDAYATMIPGPGVYAIRVYPFSGDGDYLLRVDCSAPAIAPDLSTSDLAPCGVQPVGAPFPSMRVTNIGVLNASPTNAHFFIDGFGPLSSVPVPPLSPSSFFDVFFDVPINLTPGNHNLTAFVDVSAGDAARVNDTTRCVISVPPDNDDCLNAIPVTIPSTSFGSTSSATLDVSAPFCVTSASAPGVWYTVTGTGDSIFATTCGPTTNYDTKICVYSGPCEALVCVTGNDDQGPSCPFGNLRSRVAWCGTADVQYFILVHGFSSAVGDFQLDITSVPGGCGTARCCYGDPQVPNCQNFTQSDCEFVSGTWSPGLTCEANPCPIPPLNDDCSSPEPLPIVPDGLVSVSNTTENANVTCTDTCDFVSMSPDVFYSFTLTECRRIDMSLVGGDMHLALYNNGMCCVTPALYCNDDHGNFPAPFWADPLHQPAGNLESYMGFELNAGTYIVRVGKFGSGSGAFNLIIWDNGPCPAMETVYSIPGVYANLAQILAEGIPIAVEAHSTDLSTNLLVDNYFQFILNEEMPDTTFMEIAGYGIADSLQGGFLLRVYGTVFIDSLTEPGYQTLAIAIDNAPAPAKLPTQPTGSPPSLNNWRPANCPAPPPCDTCNFAILISGGVDLDNNHVDYWDDLADFYCYKRTYKFCEENIKVFYYKGSKPPAAGAKKNSRRDAIPNAVLARASQAQIQDSVTALSRKIAACKRAGKCPTFEVVVSNHGKKAPNGGIHLLDANILSPADFTAMMQTLIDSGLCVLDAEFGQCYSGQMVDHLRNNLNTRGCKVTAASAVPNDLPSFSKRGDGGYNYWLNPKVCALQSGKSTTEAIKYANAIYDSIMTRMAAFCDSWVAYFDSVYVVTGNIKHWNSARSCERVAADARANRKKEQYWHATPFTQYCQWDTFQVTPGGYIELTFSGDAQHCGNSTVYCQDTTGHWIKKSVWNWNIPGSCRHSDFWTNGTRTLVSNDGAASGLYAIHNDDGIFTVKIKSNNTPDGTQSTSASNGQGFAGFSMGGTTETSSEFGNMTGNVSVTDAANLDLSTMPSVIGGLFGASLTVTYSLPAQNQWWEDMEVWIKVLSVTGADLGGLRVQASNASLPDSTYIIPGLGWIGEQRFPVGAISGTGNHTITLSGTAGFNIRVDAWGLRTRISNAGRATNLTIMRNGVTNDLVLNWTAATCGNNYVVQTANSENGPWTNLATVNGLATTTYTHTNGFLALPKKFYRVLAIY